MEEDIDVLGTERVVNRAIVSSVMAFLGLFGACASSLMLSPIVSSAFLVIVLGVSISAVRTLLHPDAFVTGNLRWLGIVLSVVAAIGAVLALVGFGISLIGNATK